MQGGTSTTDRETRVDIMSRDCKWKLRNQGARKLNGSLEEIYIKSSAATEFKPSRVKQELNHPANEVQTFCKSRCQFPHR